MKKSLRLLCAVLLVCMTLLCPADGASAVEMKRESFRSGGRRISVETHAPVGSGRYPAVLVLHSSAGTLFGKGQLDQFSRSLAERGLVALQVRYFDRTGTIMAGDGTIAKHLHAWEATVADALAFASTHQRVRPGSIGIFGYSLGAFLAVSAASRDARVKAVAELSGGIFAYLQGRLRRVPPMLILHGSDDQRVPIVYARELEGEALRLGTRPVKKSYPGEGHVLSREATADASRRALDFLSAQLGVARESAR